MMVEPPQEHFSDSKIVDPTQPGKLIPPALGLRMMGITLTSSHQDRPDAVNFSMLTQQPLTAQVSRMYIPNPHSITP
jgi:hypothetical protein